MNEESGVINVLTINGSPHGKIGNTEKLIHLITGAARQIHEVEIKSVYLSKENILPCGGCTRCFKKGNCSLNEKDNVENIISLFYWADAIIIGSPVYVLSISSILKKFFERCARITHRPDLDSKYGVAVSTSAGLGGDETAEYIMKVMEAMGIRMIGKITAAAFFLGKFINPEEMISNAEELGRKMTKTVYEKRRIELSSFEIERRDKFNSMMNMPSIGKTLFKADYEFWKDKRGAGEKI